MSQAPIQTEGGFVRAWRRRWDHPLFRTKQEAAVWAWMCDTAAYEDRRMATKWGPVELRRGEILVAERTLSEEFGLHRNRVRHLLSAMIAEGMLTAFSDRSPYHSGTVYGIVKYEEYQGVQALRAHWQDRSKSDGETDPGPIQDLSGTKIKEEKEVKEKKLVGGGACAPTHEGTDPRPAQSTATAPIDLDQAARTVVQRFLEVREELWPNWPNRPTSPETIFAQARAYIEDGAPPHVLIRVIEIEMRNAHRSGHHATTNPFKAYRLSLNQAIADHRSTGGHNAPAASTRGNRRNAYDPDEARRATLEAFPDLVG